MAYSTDKELLERAANASSIEFDFCRPDLGGCQVRQGLTAGWWNPLAKAGDAMNLEIELKLTAEWVPERRGWRIGGLIEGQFIWLAFHGNRLRATVMAAAAMPCPNLV